MEGREPAPPKTVTFSRFPDGFEIALLPPPRLKTTRMQFIANVLGAVVFMIFVSAFLGAFALVTKATGDSAFGFVVFFAIIIVLTLVGCILSQFDWVRETAVLEARGGLLTLVRSGGVAPKQWRLSDLTSARVWEAPSDSLRWGLQLSFRNADRVFLFEGRRRAELDWIAGLLRAALAPPRRSAPVAAAPVVYTAGGECQVCGSAMERWVVLCSKCRTPHHEECWTYNGACSTYGCREIRFTRTA